jgi:hypothetical protein
MKMTLTIWLLLLTSTVFTQSQYIALNRSEQAFKNADPATLSYLLTDGLVTEKEKIKSIFHWITDNIAYYRPESRPVRRKNKNMPTPVDEPDDGLPLPGLSDRVAAKVLKDRQTVCEGYARLFKSLCDYACIRSAIITGYARADMNRSETKFRSNHAWNAVYFDSAWHLLDATWASGYITMPSGDFVKHYDSYYFLTPPEQFIRHHYPDDLRWSLLTNPPAMSEFRTTPFRQRSFNKYFIRDFSPASGIIEAALGDTIRLAIEIDPNRFNGSVSPDSLWEEASLPQDPMYAYVKPGTIITADNKVLYDFPVQSESIQWLYVMYNDDAILRYKINIRKAKDATASR